MPASPSPLRKSKALSKSKALRAARWRRWLPLLAIVLVLGAAIGLGLTRFFDFDALALNYQHVVRWVEANPAPAIIVTVLVYVTATAASLPAGWIMTVTTGLLFGWWVGGAIALFSATAGACLLFLAARSALSPIFARMAGAWTERLAEGFRADAASYLLFLRLAPIIPFSLVNIVPALFAVPFRTYAWTTLVGIIPGTIAYVTAGSGLRSIVAERGEACLAGRPPCGTPFGPGDLLAPQMLVAFLLLAVVALIPVLLKRLRPTLAQPSRPPARTEGLPRRDREDDT